MPRILRTSWSMPESRAPEPNARKHPNGRVPEPPTQISSWNSADSPTPRMAVRKALRQLQPTGQDVLAFISRRPSSTNGAHQQHEEILQPRPIPTRSAVEMTAIHHVIAEGHSPTEPHSRHPPTSTTLTGHTTKLSDSKRPPHLNP